MAGELPVLKTERLTLKNISLENTADIIAWRSDPEIYCYFLSPHPIKAEEHINWFKNRYIYDDNRCDWMAYDEKNESVGVFGLRRDSSESNVAEVSYILAPNKKGVGFAREAVISLIEHAKQYWYTKKVIAEIHIDNLASIHFAKNLGMSVTSMNGKFCVFEMSTTGYSKKKIYIRCDGNQKIGTGHVMRCLAIANQVKILGNEPVFLVADDAVESYISEKGYKVIRLNTVWDNLETEIDLLEKLFAGRNRENVLVDSYYATPDYLKKLNSFADVTYLDDSCADKYRVKNLINYNYYALDMGYEKMYEGSNVALYLGPRYAPLRSEFEGKQARDFCGLKKILITTGGTDNYNVLEYLLEYFTSFNNVELFAIIGRFNQNRENLCRKFENYKNVHLLMNVNNMQDYMLNCDICITAGGITLYELCACGTPSLMYVLADNQLNAAKKFNDTQLIPWLGDVREGFDNLYSNLDSWISKYSDKGYWETINRMMLAIVDAKGASRIAEIVCK